jgi:hypothetical protein
MAGEGTEKDRKSGLATEGAKGAKKGNAPGLATESVFLAEDIFVKLDAWGTEVNEHAVFESRGSQVAQDLSGVFVNQGADGLELNNELRIDEQISQELAQETSVLVVNVDRNLLVDREALFAQAVAEGVFVDFLIMSMTEEGMSFERRLTNDVG